MVLSEIDYQIKRQELEMTIAAVQKAALSRRNSAEKSQVLDICANALIVSKQINCLRHLSVDCFPEGKYETLSLYAEATKTLLTLPAGEAQIAALNSYLQMAKTAPGTESNGMRYLGIAMIALGFTVIVGLMMALVALGLPAWPIIPTVVACTSDYCFGAMLCNGINAMMATIANFVIFGSAAAILIAAGLFLLENEESAKESTSSKMKAFHNSFFSHSSTEITRNIGEELAAASSIKLLV